MAWVATAIFGQPIYTFLSLRSEAARIISLYERPPELPSIHAPNRSISLEAWQSERKRAYQSCGSHLMGLAAANATMVAVLQRLRFYPNALLALADTPSHSPSAYQLQESLISALKLNLSRQITF